MSNLRAQQRYNPKLYTSQRHVSRMSLKSSSNPNPLFVGGNRISKDISTREQLYKPMQLPISSDHLNESPVISSNELDRNLTKKPTDRPMTIGSSRHYKNNNIVWTIDNTTHSISGCVALKIPWDVECRLPNGSHNSNSIRCDVESNFNGLPRKIEISNNEHDTSQAVYTSYSPTLNTEILPDLGDHQHVTLSAYSNATHRVSLTPNAASSMTTISHTIQQYPPKSLTIHDSPGLLYWCRLFQIPSFTVDVGEIALDVLKCDPHINTECLDMTKYNLMVSQTIRINGPVYSDWLSVLDKNYVGMFSNDISLTIH